MSSLTRDDVLVRIRSYLAEELELDESQIREETHFRDDLRADSLHLVELVVELEDAYGVRIPEDQAPKIETVGQAADFIAAHLPSTAP